MPIPDEVWDDPQMKRYLEHARNELQPMIDKSTFVLSVAPEAGPDPKIAMETGYMMWLDKPLIVVASKGQKVPRNIRKVAEVVIYGHPSDPKVQAQLRRALNRLGLGDARS
jgi:hypothetical protein